MTCNDSLPTFSSCDTTVDVCIPSCGFRSHFTPRHQLDSTPYTVPCWVPSLRKNTRVGKSGIIEQGCLGSFTYMLELLILLDIQRLCFCFLLGKKFTVSVLLCHRNELNLYPLVQTTIDRVVT